MSELGCMHCAGTASFEEVLTEASFTLILQRQNTIASCVEIDNINVDHIIPIAVQNGLSR
jgi:hypothetical protein